MMPDEQIGLVKENYVWSVLLHRGATPEGIFLHLPPGSCDHDLFSMTWGPTIAALSYVFDKSLDDGILQKAIAGFRYEPSITVPRLLHQSYHNVFGTSCGLNKALAFVESSVFRSFSLFRKCAMIAAHYGFSDVFDNLIISLCKFTTLSSEVKLSTQQTSRFMVLNGC